MADIQQNLENIKSAIYGEEVRGSIHDAIESMNDELVSTTAGLEAATDAANASADNADEAAESANNAASAANIAAGLANTAADLADAAAQNADATASRAGKILEDCTTATGAANTATINANAAAGSATSAAGSASAAAQNAADFASAAQQAASDANDASMAANTAAARANAAANNAENIGGVSEKTVEFTEASERKNIESGEDVKTVFGKVKKWFSSLGTAAFATVSNVLNVESPGYVMDARQGKVLKDLIDVLEAGVGDLTALETTDKDNLVSAINNLSTAISSLNNKIVTNTVLNPIGLDKYPMVLYVHKNILSDSQGIHANVEYAVDGTTNSFVMIGTRINPSRGRYLIMSRTTQDLVSTRIISEDTIGVLRVTMDGSETKYTLS